jgi:HK97 family phage portal protein
MGILDFLVPKAPQAETITDVEASLSPVENYDSLYTTITRVTRAEALSVPSVRRALDIICGIAASLPIEQYTKATGAHVEPNSSITQPDPRVPASFVYYYVAQDLKLFGVSYAYIMSVYSDGKYKDWTRIDPERVTPQYNKTSTEVIGYLLDGEPVPLSGVGSLQAFYGLGAGLLTYGARTIKAAIALEEAAKSFAEYPAPQMVIKSNGTNLTKERISKLLSAFKVGRYNKEATVYLNADVNLEKFGFDPQTMGLNDARQYVALEVARLTGIPAYFLSAEPNSMTYSNALSERKALIDFSVRNVLTAIEQRLSLADFSSSLVSTRFDLDDFLRGSALERAQVYQILNGIQDAAGNPVMTVDEIRKEEDLVK